MFVQSSDTHDGLSDLNSRNSSLWLAKRTSHPSLKPISSSARQHLVDTDDMEWVKPHPNVELIFSTRLDEVLVATDTPGLQRLRRQLLVLIRHQMDAEWEVIHTCLLLPQIEDTDLGVRHTPTEP